LVCVGHNRRSFSFLALQTSSLLSNAAQEDAVPVSLCSLDLEMRPHLLSCSPRRFNLPLISHASTGGWPCFEPHCWPSCSSETSMLSNGPTSTNSAAASHPPASSIRHMSNVTRIRSSHSIRFCYVHEIVLVSSNIFKLSYLYVTSVAFKHPACASQLSISSQASQLRILGLQRRGILTSFETSTVNIDGRWLVF
jgi:hypothetical protein